MLGPLLALMVVGAVVSVLRALFAPGKTPLYPVRMPLEDYGLLCAAAVADDPETASRIRYRLGAAGIRATVATGLDGRVRVLVFEGELYRARRVVG